MLIDSHAHLDFKEYDKDRNQVIRRAFNSGVKKIINIGCNLERSKNSVKLAEDYDNIYVTVGIHPHDVSSQFSVLSSQLYELAQFCKKVVAIGEIGLDYYRLEKEENKEIQIKAFKEQLNLAKELNLPIVIHCRDAYSDLLKILETETKNYGLNTKNYSGVTHCFGGSRKHAQRFLDLGFYLSFTGAITYTKNPEAEVFKVIKELPLDKILIETDSPYLTPEPFRGKRNEPAYVKYVAEKIAEVKGVSFEEVAETTSGNAVELFGLEEI